ncbi:MAG: isoprenylcysteine carboxylmethyltransferase family protein [Bacteroidales bacterium]|nr:isoprenylcysteine carboxylmethyltransferase family protein [Bacteroidales bacterium]
MIIFVCRLRKRELSLYLQIIKTGAGNFMFREKIHAYLLVFIQFACLIYIASTGPLLAKGVNGLLIESAGIFLAVLAIFTMQPGNFNLTPRVKKDGKLVTTGPYRLIRHPMYIAQIIAVLPLVVDYFDWYRLAAILVLTADLLVKIVYEEKQLHKHFPGYDEYAAKTKKLIPGVY